MSNNMDHNKLIENMYDIISKEFDDSRIRVWNNVQKFLITNDNNKKLLDVGVGNGKNIIFANDYNYNCIGIDISTNLLNICINKSLEVYKKDILELNSNDYGVFDKIICIAVIHHLNSIELQKKAILNMINCLNKNGSLLISVWSYEKNINNENMKNKKDYRDFSLGSNWVEWKSKNGLNRIDRYYYIHNYDTFNKMLSEISDLIPIQYNICWEKQNWFCNIKLI